MTDTTAPTGVTTGNAYVDAPAGRGWFVGNFTRWLADRGEVADDARLGLRDTTSVEVKWGIHPAGQPRPEGWAAASPAVGLSVLVSGWFVVVFRVNPEAPEHSVTLRQQGDYVLWDSSVEHRWHAVEDSVVLTVRWPA